MCFALMIFFMLIRLLTKIKNRRCRTTATKKKKQLRRENLKSRILNNSTFQIRKFIFLYKWATSEIENLA